MRHNVRGRQLSRDTDHRKALRRNMAQSLFEHGKIRTTLPKAKEMKSFIEKLITLSRVNNITNRRRVVQLMQDRRLVDENQDFITEGPSTVVQKLFAEIGPKFAGRNGGYTRIIKTAKWRIGDAGGIVILELVGDEQAPRGTVRRSAGMRRQRGERRAKFASAALKKGGSKEGKSEATESKSAE